MEHSGSASLDSLLPAVHWAAAELVAAVGIETAPLITRYALRRGVTLDRGINAFGDRPHLDSRLESCFGSNG